MFSFRNLFRPYQGLPKEIYVIFVARIVNALGCFVMPLMTIILTQSIGLSKESAGIYLSLTGLLYLPATLLGGKLSDYIGRKRVILFFDGLGILLYLLASSMKPSLDLVYVMMMAGASMTVSGPAYNSLIADLTNPKNRSGAYALSYLGWNMGFAIGPVLGGVLYQHHLPWVFRGDALTAMIALSLIALFIPETIHKTRVEGTEETPILERREEGSIFSVLAKRPILLYFSFIMFGYNFAYSQWSFMLPLQTLQLFPETGAQYFGYLAGFNGLIVMVFTPILTKLAEKTPVMRRMVYGGLFYAVGFGMLGVLNSLFFVFLWSFTFTLGEIILAISVTPFIADHSPASHRGRMNAVVPLLFNLGNTLGPLGMGKVLKYVSIESGWKGLGVSTFIFTLLMVGLEFYEKRDQRVDMNSEVESI